MSYLLDTNILSEYRKSRPHPGVKEWFDGIAEQELYLSVVTLGEIRSGVEKCYQRQPEQAQALEGWLVGLKRLYHNRIIPVTEPIVDIWGRLLFRNKAHAIDALIAATAIEHDLTIVTRNVKDFMDRDVRVLNPFGQN